MLDKGYSGVAGKDITNGDSDANYLHGSQAHATSLARNKRLVHRNKRGPRGVYCKSRSDSEQSADLVGNTIADAICAIGAEAWSEWRVPSQASASVGNTTATGKGLNMGGGTRLHVSLPLHCLRADAQRECSRSYGNPDSASLVPHGPNPYGEDGDTLPGSELRPP